MTDILDHPYECDADWRGPQQASSDKWVYRFSSADITELEAALQHAKSAGRDIPTIRKQDFPLPNLSKKLAGFAAELESGRGFILMRGLPVESHSP